MRPTIDNLTALRKRKAELRKEMKVTESLLWSHAGDVRKQSEQYLLYRLAIPLGGKMLVNTALKLISGSVAATSSDSTPDVGPASEANQQQQAGWQKPLMELGLTLLQNWQASQKTSR